MRLDGVTASTITAEEPGRMSVRSGDVTLAVRQYGWSGDVVLLLHGGPGCPDYLEPVARHLGARFRAVTFDQRGVGASTRDGRFGLEHYVADIEAVRLAMGADRIRLFGHSWGGLLAQLYLRAHPEHVTNVFLSNPSVGLGEQWLRMQREVMRFNRRRSGPVRFAALGFWSLVARLPGRLGDVAGQRVLAQVWRNYFPDPHAAPPADPTWLAGSRSVAARKTVAAVIGAPASTLDRLGAAVSAPLMVVYGRDDIYGSSVDVVVERFPGARHVRIEDCGHIPWIQAPERYFGLMDRFHSVDSSDGLSDA
jgi:proline iminopeptidase